MQKNNDFDGRERDEPQSQHTGTHIFHRIVYSIHLLCWFSALRAESNTMVAIAQLVEHLIVVQKVARSSRVGHPSKTLPFMEGSFVFSAHPPRCTLGAVHFTKPKDIKVHHAVF